MFSRIQSENYLKPFGFLVLILVVSLAATAVHGHAEDEVNLSFKAFALNMSNIATGANTSMDIHISRWSTEEERQELFKILAEKGDKKLAEALHKQEKTGWIRAVGSAAAAMRDGFPSTPLRYARDIQEGDKRRIILLTDRNISSEEFYHSSRTTDYPISIIVLKLEKDAEGKWKGGGEMTIGSKLTYTKEKNELEVELFSSEPIQLRNVEEL